PEARSPQTKHVLPGQVFNSRTAGHPSQGAVRAQLPERFVMLPRPRIVHAAPAASRAAAPALARCPAGTLDPTTASSKAARTRERVRAASVQLACNYSRSTTVTSGHNRPAADAGQARHQR